MDIYKVLKATEDIDIEKYRIPRVYYHGPIFGGYFAFAITYFHETLERRFVLENRHFSDSTILLIFKQIVSNGKYESKTKWKLKTIVIIFFKYRLRH